MEESASCEEMALHNGLFMGSAGENGNYLEAWKTYTIFATQISKHGVVVQLVRIPACHAGGRGFESRPYRKKESIVDDYALFSYITLRLDQPSTRSAYTTPFPIQSSKHRRMKLHSPSR